MLRGFELAYRDAVLLEHGDAVIYETAREDGVELTCPGDIARERDAAVCRLADEYELERLDVPVPYRPGERRP